MLRLLELIRGHREAMRNITLKEALRTTLIYSTVLRMSILKKLKIRLESQN
jgi:hypothetical protein